MSGRGKYLVMSSNDGGMFEDEEFPPDNKSLFLKGENNSGIEITWKRPKDICKDPKFIVDGAKYSDVHQGKLGNCWFLSGLVTVESRNKKMFNKVVPRDQSFDKDYTGKFKFNFWHYGKWTEVVIDDRLPTYNGELLYCSNKTQPNEFWCPLVEKAYAKLYKCYESLNGGRPNDALVDMTGGISELIWLMDTVPKDLPRTLQYCRSMGTLMTGAIFSAHSADGREVLRDSGLHEGHAYSITGMQEVTALDRTILLLRVRNLWGLSEWNGNWSDGDKCWDLLDSASRARIDNIVRDDGEFWMQYEDFVRNFDEIELCHLLEDAFTAEAEVVEPTEKKKWTKTEYRGSWVKGETAGGHIFASSQFWTNPQYKLSVHSEAVVIISLMEVIDKLKRTEFDILIGLFVYKMQKMKRPQRLTLENIYEDFGKLWPFREMTLRLELDAGTYYIIPCTTKQGQEAHFYLRIACEGSADIVHVQQFTEKIDAEGTALNDIHIGTISFLGR